MKLKVHMTLVRKVRFVFPEFELDTRNYPELEGKTLDEIRVYLEKHIDSIPSLKEEYEDLMDELKGTVRTSVIEDYPEESRFYVQTEGEEEREKQMPPPEEDINI